MEPVLIPLKDFRRFSEAEMIARSRLFCQEMKRRRTVREFTATPLPWEVIENAVKVAGSAPNGANLQPWHFSLIQDPVIKSKIRKAAEIEEREFYERRAPAEWLEALKPLGTDADKHFLEVAPLLIVIFAKSYDILPDGRTVKNYYSAESVGIATGMLISALHLAGLATLTHTPSPMSFLNEILGRPKNERPFLLLVVGFPAPEATVPDISKKTWDQIVTIH